MTDKRFDPSDPEPRSRSLGEAIDAAVGKITTGIVIAGAIVGLAIYARPGPPRFDALADGDQIVRVDTRKGTIIACEGQQTCQLVLRQRPAPDPGQADRRPGPPQGPAQAGRSYASGGSSSRGKIGEGGSRTKPEAASRA